MNRTKIGVTLVVCAILASGLMAVGFVATNGIATDGSSDASSTDSGTSTQTLNVTVYANVQGQLVPIQGANVTVYEVTVIENDTVETITIEKIAVSTTGVGGVVQIVLPEGDYTLVADYYGLRSVGILSNDTTENISMVLNAGMRGHGGHSAGYSGAATSNMTAENMLADTGAVTASGDATFTGRGMPRRR